MLTPLHAAYSTLRSDRRGIASIEYALLAALGAVLIAYSGWPLGATQERMFARIGAALDSAAQPSAAHDGCAEAQYHGQGSVAGRDLVIEANRPKGER